MKEIYYSWINGLWMGAKVLPKMSQFTRFSRVKSKNLALAKHWKIPRLSARWDQVETWWNPKTYLFNDAETSWNREMKECFSSWISCWSMTFEGAPRFPKQQNEYWISDLSVQWPGKLITFSLGGSNPEMWYVFSLRQPHCHISPKSRFPGKLYQPKIEDDWPYQGGHCHTNLLSFHHKTYIRDFFYILIKLFF